MLFFKLWREKDWYQCGKGVHGLPVLCSSMQCFSFNSWCVFWGFIKKPISRVHVMNTGYFESSPLAYHCFCLSLWALGSPSFPARLHYMAHSSWHLLLVLSDRLEGVKSLWLLFLILPGQQACFSKTEILDCCAWGRIDQYHVCGLFYIGLVNLTHCVLISYSGVGHILRPRCNVMWCDMCMCMCVCVVYVSLYNITSRVWL